MSFKIAFYTGQSVKSGFAFAHLKQYLHAFLSFSPFFGRIWISSVRPARKGRILQLPPTYGAIKAKKFTIFLKNIWQYRLLFELFVVNYNQVDLWSAKFQLSNYSRGVKWQTARTELLCATAVPYRTTDSLQGTGRPYRTEFPDKTVNR